MNRSLLDTPDPFEIWWKSYPGNRKYNKASCRKKFEKHDIEIQRAIYKDTQDRLAHQDWQDVQHIPAPEVYLNQQRWESPITAIVKLREPRDTTEPTLNKAQEEAGLEKTRNVLNQTPKPEVEDISFDKLKGIANGMYAKRICGSILESIVPLINYTGDFPLRELVLKAEIPVGPKLDQHEAAWSLFDRDFRRYWKDFVNAHPPS